MKPLTRSNCALAAIKQLSVKQRDGTTIDKELKAGQRYTEIIERMQEQYARFFTKRASYDGMKNLYSLIQIEVSQVGSCLLSYGVRCRELNSYSQ